MSARLGLVGAALAVAGVLMIGAGSLVAGAGSGPAMGPGGMMGAGMMGPGMMGPGGMMGAVGRPAPGPGDSGFVAGTQANPRVVRVLAGPGYAFTPSAITVARGETVTFEVTSMGAIVHEFMVGSADAVAVDREGTPEVTDLGMMQTKTLTFTFDGTGPYAFACHVAGHYEAGMKGTITVAG